MTLREFLPEINDNQWKLVERIILENIIGEDDDTKSKTFYQTKNQLRANQRAKLTKELESEG